MPIRVRVGSRFISGAAYKRMRTQARRKAYRKSASGSKKFAKKVMAIVRRQEETKYVATDLNSAGGPNGALWNPTPNMVNINSIRPAIPSLLQGVGDYQRIGQRIQPVSISTTLQIGLNPEDLSANTLYVCVWYGTAKNGGSWANANPLPTVNVLDNGDGTDVAWAGLRGQLNLPFDKTLVSLKRIVFRLSKTAGIQNSDNGGPMTPPGAYSTSNGLSSKSITLRFKPPKTLVYNLIGDTYPQNYAPFYYIGFCHADGSNFVPATDNTLVTVSSRTHMRFKDA